jgi:hypothetical protein
MRPRTIMNTHQGIYTIKRHHKYVGNKHPRYKSSWEARFMNFLEENKMVLKWGYEFIKIPYKLPDASLHTYYVDFYVEIYDVTGKLQKYLIEIKPNAQTGSKSVPNKPKTNNKKSLDNYNAKMRTIHINQFKWEAANYYCKSHGLTFIVLTEDICT